MYQDHPVSGNGLQLLAVEVEKDGDFALALFNQKHRVAVLTLKDNRFTFFKEALHKRNCPCRAHRAGGYEPKPRAGL